MSLVPHGKISEFFVDIRALFNQGIARAPLWFPKLAQRENSDSETNRYYWTEDMGEMERWVGATALEAISARTFDVKNDKWKKGYEVDLFDIRNDRVGLYSNNARQLGMLAARWPETMLKHVLLGGDSFVCYDGQPYWDDSHPVNMDDPSKGTYSNLFENTPFSPANWIAVSTTMKLYKSASGIALGTRPTHVFCAADIETPIRQFFRSTMLSTTDGINVPGGHDNIHRGECEVEMIPELPAGWWIVCDMSQFIRPFVYQVGMDPVFIAQTEWSSERVFEKHKYAFGVMAYGEAFPTLPQLSILCRPS